MQIRPASEWPTLEPGIYADVPPDVYHATRLPSNSLLNALARSPRHAWQKMNDEWKETPALRFGRAAHTAVLEPMRFMTDYDTARTCQARLASGEPCTATGKVRVNGHWFCGRTGHAPDMEPDRIEVVSPEDFEALTRMQGRLREAPAIRALLDQPGGFELSVIWRHERTGLLVKMRADFWSESAAILVDYKTTTDARPAEFARKLFDYGYHRQAATYLDGMAAVGAPLVDFVFIPQEKEAPYAATACRLDDVSITAGRQELDELLALWADCAASDEWPAYDVSRIHEIGLPPWALNRIYESVESI